MCYLTEVIDFIITTIYFLIWGFFWSRQLQNLPSWDGHILYYDYILFVCIVLCMIWYASIVFTVDVYIFACDEILYESSQMWSKFSFSHYSK